MSRVGISNLLKPIGDVIYFFIKGVAFYENGFGTRHAGVVSLVAVLATIEVVNVLIMEDGYSPSAGFFRRAVVQLEAPPSTPDVDTEMAENDMVTVDILMAVSDQEEVIAWKLIGWDHGTEEAECLGVKVLYFIHDDVFEAGVATICREDGAGGTEHVGRFPDLVFV